jgi:hypothetical protein
MLSGTRRHVRVIEQQAIARYRRKTSLGCMLDGGRDPPYFCSWSLLERADWGAADVLGATLPSSPDFTTAFSSLAAFFWK